MGSVVGSGTRFPRIDSSALTLTDAEIGVEPVLSCGNDDGGAEPDEFDEEEVVDTQDHDWYVVLRIASYPNTILNETLFLTIGPLI